MSDHIDVTVQGGGTRTLQTKDNTTFHTPKHAIVREDGTVPLKIVAEDAAHSSGDTGILAMVVRADTAACPATSDGDNAPLIVDGNGKLWTNAQITAVVPGTSATSLGKAEDAAHTSGDVGVMMLGVRNATATDLSAGNTDGDYEPLQVDANGCLHVIAKLAATQTLATVTTVSTVTTVTTLTGTTTLTPGTGATNLGKAEDAAHTSGDVGVFTLAVRRDTAAATGTTDGDYCAFTVDATGRLWSHVGAIDAGETHIGEVSEPRKVISVTPTVDTAANATGDAIGDKQTLTSAARVSGGHVTLDTLVMIDKANQKAACDILFFDSDPAAATITTNSAFAFSTDIDKLIGIVHVATTDWITVDSQAVLSLKNINLVLKASGSANLYAAVVGTGAPQYSAVDDLIFKYGFKQS